jgi:hypothetical protein
VVLLEECVLMADSVDGVVSFIVDAPVNVLIFVGELLLLVLLQPLEDFILTLYLRLLIAFLRLRLLLLAPWLGDELFVTQTEQDLLCVAGEVEAVDESSLIILVIQLEGVRTVHLQILVEGRRDKCVPHWLLSIPRMLG